MEMSQGYPPRRANPVLSPQSCGFPEGLFVHCYAECHMGLRPTNSNEHHGGAPSLILKDFARDVRRSAAKHLLFLIENKQKADPSLRSG